MVVSGVGAAAYELVVNEEFDSVFLIHHGMFIASTRLWDEFCRISRTFTIHHESNLNKTVMELHKQSFDYLQIAYSRALANAPSGSTGFSL